MEIENMNKTEIQNRFRGRIRKIKFTKLYKLYLYNFVNWLEEYEKQVRGFSYI